MMTPAKQREMTMLTTIKTTLLASLLVSSASVALAQYDADANPIPGAHQRGTIVETTPAFDNVFAATRPTVLAQRRQLDGDGNPIPGRGR
jgi:hypothetical protein